MDLRELSGHQASPTAGIVDSQSVKTIENCSAAIWVVCRIASSEMRLERRPARLDLAADPHLPRPAVRTTSAADYATLVPRVAA